MSDASSYEVRESNEDSGCRVEKLENELRIAKELIQSKVYNFSFYFI